MNEYNVINRCLSMLNSSKMDAMSKLRMESLLVGIKMLLLVDVEQDSMQDLESLVSLMERLCSDGSADSIKDLVDHVRKMQSSIVACLELAA